jgi:hypothetical protein
MGALDAQGVYQYDDTEQASPLDDYMNLGQASISAQLAAIRAQIAGSSLSDSGWRVLAAGELGTGWTATAGHAPRLRRIGNRVDLFGAVTLGATGGILFLLTVPEGFRTVGAYGQTFVGSVVTSGGVAMQLYLDGSSHRLQVPGTYRAGTMTSGQILPLQASWWAN